MKDTTITCLCDNNVMLSSRLRGEHGISFLIERGTTSVLFDTGQSFEVLSHNARILEKDLSSIRSLMLSHGHYDHTGGLKGACDLSHATVYAHPSIFEEKYKIPAGKTPAPIGIPFHREEIEASSRMLLSASPQKILDGVTLTGEIPRITPSEAVPDVFQKREGDSYVKDDILDDQSLVIDTGEETYVVLGCNHAGLINTIEHCKTISSSPITTVFGGTHLVAADSTRMKETIHYLKAGRITLHGYHCTGDRASFELRAAMPDTYEKGLVGMEYVV